MGWSVTITADRKITKTAVRAALNSIAGNKVPEQSWGWSMQCDVHHPKGNELTIGGAWFSAKHAKTFAQSVARHLQQSGYNVNVGEFG